MKVERLTCKGSYGVHQLVYSCWGDLDNPPILCLHGLTRNRRDFDTLANVLAQNYQVICLDIVGRGESDWLPNARDYDYPVYIEDILILLAHLKIKTVDLLGTSMGGLIGMWLAACPHSPVRRLILNDIGPWVPQVGLMRIAQYLLQPPVHFTSMEEVETYVRKVHAQFGLLTTEQWRELAQHSVKSLPEGGYRLTYDPKIAWPFKEIKEINLWSVWEQIRCPVLLLWGEHSDLLSTDIIEQMKIIHPTMEVVTVPHTGHAPALKNAEQIQIIQKWLMNSDASLHSKP